MRERLLRLGERLPRTPELKPDRQSAVAIVLRADQVLLMRRIEREGDRWSGQVSLPGGHRDARDPDLLATAVRETREEVLVDLEREAHFLGCLPALQARAAGGRLDMWITPFVFMETGKLEPQAGPEAAETFWLPLSLARSGALNEHYQWTSAEGHRQKLPSWRYREQIIWGMTHHLLGQLIELLFAEPLQSPE